MGINEFASIHTQASAKFQQLDTIKKDKLNSGLANFNWNLDVLNWTLDPNTEVVPLFRYEQFSLVLYYLGFVVEES
jgi:hypothetical protein